MSNVNQRYNNRKQQQQQQQGTNHNKIIPKFLNPNDTNSPKFSSSFRQSLSTNQSHLTATSSSSSSSSSSTTVPSKGNFVNYLPQDEAAAAGLDGLDPIESQKVVDHLNSHLSRLLKLQPKDFWRQVASDTSLHDFLHTYLQFRSRWYDFPYHGSSRTLSRAILGDFDLTRRVFMLLYRISSNRDPDAPVGHSLSSKDHAVILQDKKLLDLPKLLDICAVYGHENEDLTRSLVGNALKAQPWIYDYFPAVMPHFLNIIQTMQKRCSSFIETLSSSASNKNNGSIQSHTDLVEVMDFINDAIMSMDAFVLAYKSAALFFSCPVEMSHGNEEVLSTLAQLHDSLIPSLLRAFSIIYKGGENRMKSDISVSSKMLSLRLVSFGWKLLDICYLNDEVFQDNLPVPAVTKMFPANVEDPGIRADILVQTFREINGVTLQAQENYNGITFLQNLEKSFNMMSRLESLQKSGWIFMDDEQIQYLSGIMMLCVPEANITGSSVVNSSATSNKVAMDEDSAIMESKISQIKDLFPDYGKGFLYACLEVYNHNPEEVIQQILEGTLHNDLKCLDTSLETIPKPKSAVIVNKTDKGKGKLVESSTIPSTNAVSSNLQKVNEPSVSSYSSSTIGRFVRKSKNESPTGFSLDARDEKDNAKTAALLSQYEYEDEYDDSFDDLGLSVAESGFADNETLIDKSNSNFVNSWSNESQNPAQAAPKWGSRKRPQFYVKDGKNYSYKVEGSVAVANATEASILSEGQRELIHGLGRGGNLPQGAVRKMLDHVPEADQDNRPEFEGRWNTGNNNPRGRGNRGGKQRESNVDQDNNGSDNAEGAGRGNNIGNQRGGRGGQRGGGRSNQYRKNQAMKKHLAGLSGF